MIHDNARPHTAAATQNLITTFGWEQFDHPPYNPDLAPSDFHLFLHLKSFLAGRRFHDDSEVKETVTMCFTSQAASFYDEGIQKLVQRYDKCLNNGVYIKWQYTWFVIYSCFFLNSPSELTFWITYVSAVTEFQNLDVLQCCQPFYASHISISIASTLLIKPHHFVLQLQF